MKFNSNRTRRLAFDAVAASYDSARPSFSGKIVADLTAQANLKPGSRVLEVGSGTGQLTLALLREGLHVTALEPGDVLREKLIENTSGGENIFIRPDFFEEYADGNAPFDAIVSANAWQWIDPAVGYSHAAKLLRPRGALGVLWNFPVISDQRLQERLNKEVFSEKWPDFVQKDDFMERVRTTAREGRIEMVKSGYFSDPWWIFHEERLSLTVDVYITLLVSYANAAASPRERQVELRRSIRETLGNATSIGLVNHIYIAVSHRL